MATYIFRRKEKPIHIIKAKLKESAIDKLCIAMSDDSLKDWEKDKDQDITFVETEYVGIKLMVGEPEGLIQNERSV